MPDRLDILKTYKLFIAGAFPRTESGRTMPAADAKGRVIAHLCRASRKDLRDAVSAARKAIDGWSSATAYNRGQVLYRMAEMLEGKSDELAGAIAALKGPAKAGARRSGRGAKSAALTPASEVQAAIDRLVAFAGWADKYAQVLGCNNPVAGPYYNFTVPEPVGVVGVIAPDDAPLLGLVSLIAPVICAGGTVVALGSERNAIPAAVLGEVCATSDVPAGVVNILTGFREELVPFFASHRDIDAIHTAGVDGAHAEVLRRGSGENVKRVTVRSGVDWVDAEACASPWWIEPFVEFKTIWHPSAT